MAFIYVKFYTFKKQKEAVPERRSARVKGEKPPEKARDVTPDRSKLPEILFKGRIKYIHDFYECASVCDTLL